MKTTLNINDLLYRQVRVKAAEQGRTVSALVEEGLYLALNEDTRKNTRHRVSLPLIEGGHFASLDQEMTSEKTAEILLAQETVWSQ